MYMHNTFRFHVQYQFFLIVYAQPPFEKDINNANSNARKRHLMPSDEYIRITVEVGFEIVMDCGKANLLPKGFLLLEQ